MPAISVGSVEVDVVPNATGVRQRMQNQLVPAANQVGDEVGRIIGRYLTSHVANAFVQGINNGGQRAQPAATRQGNATGGAFARAARARIQAALADLPDIRIDADSTPAQREIAAIRTQLQALTEVDIGVDIDSAEAQARITRLQERLDRLSASDVDVQTRIDTAAASAQLAAFQAQINRLDGQTASVDVDTRSATANLNLMTTAALAFGPALIPVLPVVAAGLGAVAAAATAAGVGLGAVGLVAIPAFKQISGVLQAQKAAQDAATQATQQGGQAAAQAASRANQLAGAQQSLATAERNGARQIAQAQQAVAQARDNAAQRARQAAQAVRSAEDALADAQRDATRAQEDLTQARRTAARELQDLNSQLAGAELDQRQAVLDLQDAERELQEVRAKGSAATAGELQRAQLNYDRAKQGLSDQTTETKRLAEETKAANKAGVDGSETVRSAQENLAQAQESVADRTQALRDAQADQARTAVQNAKDVAQAQENVAVAQQNAADAVASAQRQLAQAQQQSAGGADQAAIAQAKYREELAKLTPEARDTMDAYLGLRDAFSSWSKSLQPAVMPIFTRAFNGLKNSLPGLTPFVLEAAGAIQRLQDRASEGFKSPWWKEFKTDLEGAVGPAIEGLGISFGNIFKGMAGIIDGFLPKMDTISAKMQGITGKFANWGTGLKGSPEFEKFLAYSSEMAPKLWDTLKQIAGAVIDVATAMKPITTIVLQILGGLAQGISWVATRAPWVIQLIYGVVAAMTAWRLATLLWNGITLIAAATMKLFNLVIGNNPIVRIVLVILALAGAIYLLWTKCDWFRTAVLAVWDGIKAGVQATIDWFAGPFTDFFTETIPGVFRSLMNWVKNNWPWILIGMTGPIGLAVVAIIEHWDDIKGAFSSAWGWIKKWVIYPIRDFFTDTIPGWGTTLKDAMVGAFEDARDGIKGAWDGLKKIARAPIQYVVDIVYNKGIVGVWNNVATAFGADPLKEFHFARGGVMPGYTPGRDVHNFVSPTGGRLALSGGEAIMRPEFTRAVGSGFVHSMNAIASNKGAQGVKAALAPVFGGNPSTPTDTTLRYADGGIFGWIGGAANKIAGAGSAAWNKVKEGASWLGDTLEASARAGVKNVVDPLLKKFPGMDTFFGKMLRRMPTKIIDALFGYSKESDKKGGSGVGGPKITAALRWAKAQAGKPYIWGGVGPKGFDCSGFMGAIENVIRGQKPNRRRWATGAFSGSTAPAGWVKNGASAFKVGITNAGVGHTAGTLGKTKVESRGGQGVVVGPQARGYNSPLFTDWYGFQPGKYDQGGYLQPGLNLAYNGTGRPEPVFTTQQANALTSMAGKSQQPVVVELHPKAGAIGDFIDVRIQQHDQALVQVLNAS